MEIGFWQMIMLSSVGLAPTHNDCVLRKGDICPDMHMRRRHHVKMEAKMRVMLVQAKEHQRCQHTIRSWQRGLDQTPPYS